MWVLGWRANLGVWVGIWAGVHLNLAHPLQFFFFTFPHEQQGGQEAERPSTSEQSPNKHMSSRNAFERVLTLTSDLPECLWWEIQTWLILILTFFITLFLPVGGWGDSTVKNPLGVDGPGNISLCHSNLTMLIPGLFSIFTIINIFYSIPFYQQALNQKSNLWLEIHLTQIAINLKVLISNLKTLLTCFSLALACFC